MLLRLVLSATATLAAAAEWPLPDARAVAVPGGEAPAAASPRSYPDAEGFAARSAALVRALAGEDLMRWRTGYFAGGDPGKYLPGAAMARLLTDPDDALARRLLNDARSPSEHYPAAAVNWARLIPLFRAALSDATVAEFGAYAERADYLSAGDSEHQQVMARASALVLAERHAGPRFAGLPRAEAQARLKSWLHTYVKQLYAVGQDEWDSPAAFAFGVNALLNVYDFSSDEDCRLLARAGLDWYAAAYALKHTGGLYCGPTRQGWAGTPATTLADQLGWLWWGAERGASAPDFRHALHAATSAWRPNLALTRLARRQVDGLPAEQRNAKPDAWCGSPRAPVPAQWRETVWVSPSFTLGCLERGAGPQAVRMQLAIPAEGGALALTGGTPVGRAADGRIQRFRYAGGNGCYDQTAQVGATVVCLSSLPAAEPLAYAYVAHPAAVRPELVGGWWIAAAGQAWIGVRGAVPGEVAQSESAQVRNPTATPILRFPGQRTGFVLIAAERARFAERADFLAALDRTGLAFEAQALAATLTTLDGRAVSVRWREGADAPAVLIDGAPAPAPTAVYAGPLVRCAGGILQVGAGEQGFVVDFSGERPLYRAAP